MLIKNNKYINFIYYILLLLFFSLFNIIIIFKLFDLIIWKININNSLRFKR